MEITGLKELNQRLNKLSERVERNIMSAAVRAGANEIKKEAVMRLGGKKSDIVVAKSRAPKGTTLYKIWVSKKKWYLKFKEFGTKPHVIKTEKALSDGTVFFGKEVKHPGQKAEPFLRPALDEGATRAVSAMAKKVKERLEKEAAKR